jgi:hypothetical protein
MKAQERFEAEARWWREHREAKGLFVMEFEGVATRDGRIEFSKKTDATGDRRRLRLRFSATGPGSNPRTGTILILDCPALRRGFSCTWTACAIFAGLFSVSSSPTPLP